jgi:hypothetical protein
MGIICPGSATSPGSKIPTDYHHSRWRHLFQKRFFNGTEPAGRDGDVHGVTTFEKRFSNRDKIIKRVKNQSPLP